MPRRVTQCWVRGDRSQPKRHPPSFGPEPRVVTIPVTALTGGPYTTVNLRASSYSPKDRTINQAYQIILSAQLVRSLWTPVKFVLDIRFTCKPFLAFKLK